MQAVTSFRWRVPEGPSASAIKKSRPRWGEHNRRLNLECPKIGPVSSWSGALVRFSFGSDNEHHCCELLARFRYRFSFPPCSWVCSAMCQLNSLELNQNSKPLI